MESAVAVVGVVAEAGAWAIVAFGKKSVWIALTPAIAAMGAAALAAGSPSLSAGVAPGLAAAAGAAAGAALYLATRAFVTVVRGWAAFRRDSLRLYAQRGTLPLALALLLSAGVIVAGEELFWRGLVMPELGRALDGRTAGALLSWALFVGANLPARNLAIWAGAAVGGAVWTGIALWTGGVLASLVCHSVWTALMLAFPVVRGAEVAS